MSVAVDAMAAAEQQITLEHQLREKVVNEEFKIWKKTVPLLYNSIHTHALKWPLLTVDFSPKYTISDDKKSLEVLFVTGSNTSQRDQDTVSLRTINLPSTMSPDFASFGTGENIIVSESASNSIDLGVKRLWSHAGEVNRAKFSPIGEKFVTFDNAGVVHLYDINQEMPVDFKFHKTEGYCLEWVSENQFLSGANDSQIALWNASSPAAPEKQFNTHTAVINDISFSKPAAVLFGSVADDFTTQIHDLRTTEDSPAIKIVEKHLQNAIQLHPEIGHLFATGGKDNLVNVYDARLTDRPIRQLFGHNDLIFGLRWDNIDPLQLYSWGLDKRVISWDLNYLTEEYAPPSTESQETKKRSKHTEDPCLQFIHAGHTNRVNDFAVHPSIPNLFASVGDDTLLEIYQPKTLREGDEDDEDEMAEEQDPEENEAVNGEADAASGTYEKKDADEDIDQIVDSPKLEEKTNFTADNGLHEQFGINSKPAAQEEHSNSDVDMAE
ncbi:WD40 repeat-like protein [Metschnikowia bicuspidata var. bicuspidata NRRL YB-4993]|uniref:WD40 repeat-like protein n=1 Tax=Metschnikowia bicuspidata var. bicuspidata NRRL YB-4993 TaxID=869754 RepID=A0A1A0HGS7_9ASCO|nr:WD40 repeat-like protein [Metschnikowia bicuspidata var. bicuspidata NRRL YB-4993]OBA23379.1 WD40 repeat-like protein [Metschnikowia bicuspidata var. bicuspidata NRRL YB-4993]